MDRWSQPYADVCAVIEGPIIRLSPKDEEPGRRRRVRAAHAADALDFIASEWAEDLAELGGLPIAEIRQRLPALKETDSPALMAS